MRDSFSCGPLVPIDDAPSWQKARQEYWGVTDSDGFGDPQLLCGTDTIIFWLGTGTADQIALAWFPAYLRAIDVRVPRIELIQIERNGRGIEIVNLGMMNPEELSAHPPALILTDEYLAELDIVWRALIASDPSALVAYVQSSSVRFPLLQRALREFLARYPDATSG